MARKKQSRWTKSRALSVSAFAKWLRGYVKKTSRIKLIFLGILLVFITYVLGYYLVVRPIQEYNQKKEFDKAEAEIIALANRIQEKIGKADQVKTEKSCGRPNMKSGKGDLGCSTSISISYTDEDAARANSIMQDVSKLGNGAIYSNTGFAQGKEFLDLANINGKQAFAQDATLSTELSCYINYAYASAIYPDADLTPNTFRITLGCYGSALKAFYPLRD